MGTFTSHHEGTGPQHRPLKIFAGLLCSTAMLFTSLTATGSATAAEPAGADANGNVVINDTNFPDPAFRKFVSENYDQGGDTPNDGILSPNERSAGYINLNGDQVPDAKQMQNIEGIQYFQDLKTLDLNNTTSLKSLDVSANKNLERLEVGFSSLPSLDVSKNPNLNFLFISGTDLRAVDLSQNTKLATFTADDSGLKSLDLTHNPELTHLEISSNYFNAIDLSQNTKLEEFDLGNDNTNPTKYGNFTALDLSKNVNLKKLRISDHQLKTIDLSHNPDLEQLYIWGDPIESLDLSKNVNLRVADIHDTKLSSLDLSKNQALSTLDIHDNEFATLDVSSNTNLHYLNVSYNELRVLDLSHNPNLVSTEVVRNKLVAMKTGPGKIGLTGQDNQSIYIDADRVDLTQYGNPVFDRSKVISGSVKGGTMDEKGLLVADPSSYDPVKVTYEYQLDDQDRSVLESTLYFTPSKQDAPPSLSGTNDAEIERGKAFDPMDGVKAEDNSGKTLKVSVQGKVDTSKPGLYTLTYTAVDSAHRKTVRTRIVTVKPVEKNLKEDLNKTNKGGFDSTSEVKPSTAINLTFDPKYRNTDTHLYVLSDRYDLGKHLIPADGELTVTLPAGGPCRAAPYRRTGERRTAVE